jgi:hypothetical protein
MKTAIIVKDIQKGKLFSIIVKQPIRLGDILLYNGSDNQYIVKVVQISYGHEDLVGKIITLNKIDYKTFIADLRVAISGLLKQVKEQGTKGVSLYYISTLINITEPLIKENLLGEDINDARMLVDKLGDLESFVGMLQ